VGSSGKVAGPKVFRIGHECPEVGHDGLIAAWGDTAIACAFGQGPELLVALLIRGTETKRAGLPTGHNAFFLTRVGRNQRRDRRRRLEKHLVVPERAGQSMVSGDSAYPLECGNCDDLQADRSFDSLWNSFSVFRSSSTNTVGSQPNVTIRTYRNNNIMLPLIEKKMKSLFSMPTE
jgi:hypothetical protein